MNCRWLIAFAALGTLLAVEGHAKELGTASSCTTRVQPEVKKGLGGLLDAARRGGVSSLLRRSIKPADGAAQAAIDVASKAVDDAATEATRQSGECVQKPQESQQREWHAID